MKDKVDDNFLSLDILNNMLYFVHREYESFPNEYFDEFKIYYTKKVLLFFEVKRMKFIKIRRKNKKYYNTDTSDGKVEGWYNKYSMSDEAIKINNMLNYTHNKSKQDLYEGSKLEGIIDDLREEYIDGSEYSIVANLVLDKIEKKFKD